MEGRRKVVGEMDGEGGPQRDRWKEGDVGVS